MRTSDFDYYLPPELIAQTPLARRDQSRLMVVDRSSGEVTHRRFQDIVEFVRAGDCVVLNDTRVIKARLYGTREATGGRVEVLLLRELEPGVWEALTRPSRRVRAGDRLIFGGGQAMLRGTVLDDLGEGRRRVLLEVVGEKDEGGSVGIRQVNRRGVNRGIRDVIREIGNVPLPPYIKRPLPPGFEERYQTVYATREGSAAAPTAGFHFTEEILDSIRQRGAVLAFLTLDIGLGTFRPVKSERVEDHRMHEEFYEIPEECAACINRTRASGGKVLAVGTTSVRAIESAAALDGAVRPGPGSTALFIYPGYRFKVTDMLLTNFHLPRSTLLMLVSAFGGRELILRAYQEAVRERYRFYSFGDAMLIL